MNSILSEPPYGEGVDEAKVCRSYSGMAEDVGADIQTMTTSALLLILNSTRASDIPNILKGLGQEQQDHLMAYLYKASSPFTASTELTIREWLLLADLQKLVVRFY